MRSEYVRVVVQQGSLLNVRAVSPGAWRTVTRVRVIIASALQLSTDLAMAHHSYPHENFMAQTWGYWAYSVFFSRLQVFGFLVYVTFEIFPSRLLSTEVLENSEKIPVDTPIDCPSSLRFLEKSTAPFLSNK